MSQPYESSAAGVRRALAALGGSADEVAAGLARRGIRGFRCEPCTCPIVGYLADAYGGAATRVEVSSSQVLVWFGEPCGEPARATLPEPVREFVHRFDFGRYDDLAVGA